MTKSTSKLFQSEDPKEMKEDAMNLPEEVKEEVKEEEISKESTEVVDTPVSSPDDIQDVDLSAIKKKRFRINGDNNKILELNTSDLQIVSRLSTAYEKLMEDMEKVGTVLSTLPENEDELDDEKEKLMRKQLKEIDDTMKERIDYIFDAPVSAACSDGGSMYDPFEGMFRFEHIIEAILKLYERNLDSEFNKMRRRVSAKTSKYVKKYHN